jgi:hypothetical protein
VLVVGLTDEWLIRSVEIKLLDMNDFSCKFVNFVLVVALTLSSWIRVAVTLEGTLVCCPLRVKRICTRKTSVIVVCCLIIITAALHVHILIALGSVPIKTENHTENTTTPGHEDHNRTIVQICVPTSYEQKLLFGNVWLSPFMYAYCTCMHTNPWTRLYHW